MRNCPAGPASSLGPVWKLLREGAVVLEIAGGTAQHCWFRPLHEVVLFHGSHNIFRNFEQNVVLVHAKCVTKLAQVRRCLWPDRSITMSDIISLGETETPNSLDLPAMAGPRLQLRPDLPAYGRTETSNSPDLPAYGRTVRQTYVRPAGPPCLWPDRPPAFGTYKVTEWREGVQPQKTWIQKRIWKPRSSRFSSPTSIVCQGLVQTGLALHPMSKNRWSLEISSLKMCRLQCGLFLTQDVSPAVWGWHLLNARCFACSFGMAPSCLPFEHCNINFSCHSNIALWSAIL